MRKSTVKRVMAAAMLMTLTAPASLQAQDTETSVEVAYISSKSANIREQPSTSAAIVGKAYTNDAFRLLGTEGDWLKIENPYTGKPAYLANSVASEGSFTAEYTPLYTAFKDSGTTYENTECSGKGSRESCTTTSWNFEWPAKKYFGPVVITKTVRVTDASGRSNAFSSYYKGTCTPAHIIVTDECDDEGNVTGKTEPFIITAIAEMDAEGIIIGGTVYDTVFY